MRRCFTIIGAFTVFMWLMGVIGVADYKVCIGAPNTCEVFYKGVKLEQQIFNKKENP